MFRRVVDLQTQLAAAAVEIQRAVLKQRLGLVGVEVFEGDEVVQKRRQVAVPVRQLVDRGDRLELGLERLVFCQQQVDRRAGGGRR